MVPERRIVRVASVQLAMVNAADPAAFFARMNRFTRIAAEYGCDFVCFPEMVTFPLAAMQEARLSPDHAFDLLDRYTADYEQALREMAGIHRINIIGGSHLCRAEEGGRRNIAFFAGRDGTIHRREKIHPTPDEAQVWGVEGGDALDVIETDCGPVAVLICYDSEFPELGRRAVDIGAPLVFVPFYTDTRQGYCRVRYSCAARCIENQSFYVLSGSCGILEGVENVDIHYSQSAILTPCDLPFARDGIAAEADPNIEGVIFADLDLGLLEWARREGAVRNLAQRRPELYDSQWKGR